MTVTAELLGAVEPHDPIGLDELVQAADLQSRTDRKYVLTRHEALAVLSALPADARVLEIERRRAFAYESVYFDTPELLAYHLTALRRRRRFKVRTRAYLDSGEQFLEVKTRTRGTTVKHRLPHDDDLRSIGDAGRAFVDGVLSVNGVAQAPLLTFAPALITTYSRITILLPGATTTARATVDSRLVWVEGPVSVANPETVILETKTATAPSFLDRMLWRRGLRPNRVSKYGTGLAVLHPDYPGGPWRRVIRRHFEHLEPVGAGHLRTCGPPASARAPRRW